MVCFVARKKAKDSCDRPNSAHTFSEEAAFRLVSRECQSFAIARNGGFALPKFIEKACLRSGEEMVVLQCSGPLKCREQEQTGFGPFEHGDGYRAVELHNRRGGDAHQFVIEPDDTKPIPGAGRMH